MPVLFAERQTAVRRRPRCRSATKRDADVELAAEDKRGLGVRSLRFAVEVTASGVLDTLLGPSPAGRASPWSHHGNPSGQYQRHRGARDRTGKGCSVFADEQGSGCASRPGVLQLRLARLISAPIGLDVPRLQPVAI